MLGIVQVNLTPFSSSLQGIVQASLALLLLRASVDSTLAAPIIDGVSIQKKSCKPNAASLLIAEAQPIFMGEAHNVRATSRF